MSKMFSVVTLDASHSLMTEHFVPGSPDGLDELLDCDEISEVLAEWPLGDTIEAKIQTYLYGDGETVRADEEDLAFFREHFDELNASLSRWRAPVRTRFGSPIFCATKGFSKCLKSV